MSNALSPDTRDALLAELRRRTTTDGFHFLSADHIAKLNETTSSGAPILSLYMELTPETRMGGAWQTVLRDLCDRAMANAGEHKDVVKRECDRISETLERGLPRTGRGLAIFANEELGLFEQLGTAMALQSEVHLHPSPYVRPLARMRDENDRFVIALVSAHQSRFFFAQIGLVEEVYTLEGEELQVTDHITKDQRQDMTAQMRKHQAQRSAHALQLIAKELDARHIVYSASPDMVSDFLDDLDQNTRQRVAAEFSCDINATTPEVADAAEVVQREVEGKEEMETLGKVRELMSTRAVGGLDDTLDMLNQQRVMTLLVDDEATIPGGLAPVGDGQLPMLTSQTSGTYPATGTEIEEVPDLIEHMLDRAMAQGASLELVRNDDARASLSEFGPAAALLRF